MAEETRSPNLLPVAFVLGVLLWLFTMTGGRQIFVNEVLSKAYDSQAEHFLRGDVGVDGDAIRHEIMIVNGKSRMYFWTVPSVPAHSTKLYLSGRARALVAHLWILRRNDRVSRVRWTRSDGLARVSIVESLAKLAGQCFAGWIRSRLAAAPASRKSFHL